MNWEGIAAIGEFVSAGAVVASLIYVGVQIRQSVRISRAEAQRASSDQYTKLSLRRSDSPELRSLWTRAMTGARLGDLTADEKIIMGIELQALFNNISMDFNNNEMGLAHNAHWLAISNMVKMFVAHPLIRDWWATIPNGVGFHLSFFNWIDTLVLDNEPMLEKDS